MNTRSVARLMNLIFGEISRKRARPPQCLSTSRIERRVCTCVCACVCVCMCVWVHAVVVVFVPLDPPTSPFRSAIAPLPAMAPKLKLTSILSRCCWRHDQSGAEFRNFEFGFFPVNRCTLCKLPTNTQVYLLQVYSRYRYNRGPGS